MIAILCTFNNQNHASSPIYTNPRTHTRARESIATNSILATKRSAFKLRILKTNKHAFLVLLFVWPEYDIGTQQIMLIHRLQQIQTSTHIHTNTNPHTTSTILHTDYCLQAFISINWNSLTKKNKK